MTSGAAPRRVLLVGEGDFTFALALATVSPELSLTATGFDAREALVAKYRDAPHTLRKLEARGARVVHGVDATRLGDFEGGGFDEVVFSHPHLGVEDQEAHFRLLAHYFASAIKVAGVVRVTLAASQASLWRCDAAAARGAGLDFVSASPFFDDAFPGYVRRRSLRGASFRARTPEKSSTRAYAAAGADVPDVPWAALPRATAAAAACPACGRRFRDGRALATHWKDAHAATLGPLPPTETSPGPENDDDEPEGDGGAVALAAAVAERSGAAGACEVCGLAFDSEEARAAHAASLAPAAPRQLPCACGKTFGTRRALDQHAVGAHSIT